MIQLPINGIDRVLNEVLLPPDLRYGMVTAAHARTSSGFPARRALFGLVQLECLFGPEHGLSGVAAAGEGVADSLDPLTRLPVYSLYHDHKKNDLPVDALASIDALIYDIPDLGTRFFTYISTCLRTIDSAAKHKKKLYILDRPNPLGGSILEGVTLDFDSFNFVGPYSLPVRYGLTIGELASLYVAERGLDIDLTVIPVDAWSREESLRDTGQVFVMPSPNMPSFDTALLYPGTCLIEGTNLSEGRGTPRPFSWFGAPWIDQESLFLHLNSLPHPGLALRPQTLIPSASKHKGIACPGIAIEVLDPDALRAHRFMLRVLETIETLYPEDFAYIIEGDNPPFMRSLLGQGFNTVTGRIDYAKLLAGEAVSCDAFGIRASNYLLYD